MTAKAKEGTVMRFSIARTLAALAMMWVLPTGDAVAQNVCSSGGQGFGGAQSAVGEWTMRVSPGTRCAIMLTGPGLHATRRVHTPPRQGTVVNTDQGFAYTPHAGAVGSDFFQISWYAGSEHRIVAVRVTIVGGGNPFAPGAPAPARK